MIVDAGSTWRRNWVSDMGLPAAREILDVDAQQDV